MDGALFDGQFLNLVFEQLLFSLVLDTHPEAVQDYSRSVIALKTPKLLTTHRKNRGGTFFTMLIFIMLLVSSALMYYYFQKSRVLEQQLMAVRRGEQPADSLAANVFNWNKDSEPQTAQATNDQPAAEATPAPTPVAAVQSTPAASVESAATPAALDLNPIAETEADAQIETEVMTEEVPVQEDEAGTEPTATPGSGKIESIYDLQPPVVVRTPRSR